MIKLFRNLRKSLLFDSKTAKYIKYGIGEVVLVVIGILIAVQINTWNQKRERLKLETILLSQLKDEMLHIYDDVYADFNLINLGNKSHFKVLDYLDQNLTYGDSMCFDFAIIKRDEYIYPANAVYSRIKDVGLDIIRNDSIRDIAQGLYETLFPRLSKSNSFNPDISEVFDDYYFEHFRINTDYSLKFNHVFDNDTISGEIYSDNFYYPYKTKINGEERSKTIGFVPLDFESLKKDPKFRILLEKTEGYRIYKERVYRFTKEDIKQLIGLIDQELKL